MQTNSPCFLKLILLQTSHTGLFEATDIIKTVVSFSKTKKKHFHLLHIVHLQFLKFHQCGDAQRTIRADMLGDCCFPAHPTAPLGPVMWKNLHTALQKPLFILYLNPAGTTPPQAALLIMSSSEAELRGVEGKHNLLGTRLIAFRGLRTRTVRIADKLMFWRSREYSTILQKGKERERERKKREKGSLKKITILA